MRNTAPCSLLVSLVLAGCTSTTDAIDPETGETTATTVNPETSGAPEETSGAPSCIPGYEGCPCMDGACLQGLSCFSDLCVDVGGESSVDPESSGAPAESSSSEAESSEAESSSTGDASSSESSSTMVEPACTDGEVSCESGTLTTCVDETPAEQSCDDFCAPSGFTSSGCEDVDSCLCDGYLDASCQLGASAYCYCYEWAGAGTCTTADYNDLYGTCFDGSEPAVECFGDYVDGGGQIDCNTAISACL